MKSKAFWDRVNKCEHKNLSPDYYPSVPCANEPDACGGGTEEHCLDCGAYITSCHCGFEDGIYGWSYERRSYEEELKRFRQKDKDYMKSKEHPMTINPQPELQGRLPKKQQQKPKRLDTKFSDMLQMELTNV